MSSLGTLLSSSIFIFEVLLQGVDFVVEDGYDLLERDAFEVVQELVDGRAVFESFEKRGDGEASVLEDPGTADFVRASFDGVAIVPVAHCGAFSLYDFDVLGEFSIDTAGMALDDVVQVEYAAGCGHRLYSDRGPVEWTLPLAGGEGGAGCSGAAAGVCPRLCGSYRWE